MKACEGLSKKRKGIAEEISLKIKEGLTSLNFFQADFQVEVAPAAVPGPQGMDQVRFLLSANPGEPLKPLDQVASGGELSRIMLAIKSVLAKAEGIPTLLFDEIDSGISGRTAQKVAEKLQSISRDHQVICISHLPQIVAMADVHFRIQKERHGEYTVTSIQKLNRSQMIEEIARLLGGTRITAHVLENAEEMKALAEHMKKNPDGAPDGA